MTDASTNVKRWLINGIAITIPLVVTLIVLGVVLSFVLDLLSPIVDAVAYLWPNEPSDAMIQLTTLSSLIGSILLVGAAADVTSGELTSTVVHRTLGSLPVVGTIYATTRRASDILLDDDTEQFQDVKLVEFPHENAHMLAFLTADTPDTIEDAMDVDEMLTLMIPLGPNPTTNGFIMHVSADRVTDVDMTVEDAIRSIATLGVATDVADEE